MNNNQSVPTTQAADRDKHTNTAIEELAEQLKELDINPQTLAMIADRSMNGTSFRELSAKYQLPLSTVHAQFSRASSQEAIKGLTKKMLVMSAPDALRQLQSLMTQARSEKVRMEVALAVLDRAGISEQESAPTGSAVQVNINLG